ncbi:hypothetical protein CJ030_MR6G015613 [Morella rubra]|uniref:Uncharacterized protein n=1 Tax=Morella rubra TaxID=262757 RepID=A0A6A1VBL2_9ROSI|nr:hypothetical protein CJ030_MR6G015610 [Morella rubra]KAB1209187.1 hypothetical protein CJ030_MR6G015613 [Morella rubra]
MEALSEEAHRYLSKIDPKDGASTTATSQPSSSKRKKKCADGDGTFGTRHITSGDQGGIETRTNALTQSAQADQSGPATRTRGSQQARGTINGDHPERVTGRRAKGVEKARATQ